MNTRQGSKLESQVAVVTGAGSSGPGVGTGKAISVLFAREGAKVVLVDKLADRAEETLGLIQEEGGEASIVLADLADPASARYVVEQAMARYGSIDVLINNAAIAPSVGILATSDELYHELIAINLTAPFMLTREVLPLMVEGGGGSIVNITSITALRGSGAPGQGAYAVSKAGLIGLMIDTADAFGTKGIRVNCIAPGIIDTPIRNAALLRGGHDPKQINMGARTSLGFEGDAWDIARAALFLAGPDGRYITGVLLPVDGGSTARSH